MAIRPSLIHSPSGLLMPRVAGPRLHDSAAPYDAAQGELAHTSASAAAASMMSPPRVSDFASGGPGSMAGVFMQVASRRTAGAHDTSVAMTENTFQPVLALADVGRGRMRSCRIGDLELVVCHTRDGVFA